jgi:hypothetical protein
MTTTRHLDRKDVPAHLRGDYAGQKFAAQLCERVTIPATAGLWDGGSRDVFGAVELATGNTRRLPDADPFNGAQRDARVTIPPGIAIVRRTYFQGKDLGLTFYLRPDDAAPLLPAPGPDLDPTLRAVLQITRSYIPKARADEARRQGITPETFSSAKALLMERGLLNAAGAITTAGKNAL